MKPSEEHVNDEPTIKRSSGGPHKGFLNNAKFWEPPRPARADISPGSVDAWQLALAREAQELRRRGDDEGLKRNRLADALRESAFDRLVQDLGDHGLGDYADALVTGDYSGLAGARSDEDAG
jgi:hypothetical protein